jgi:hypothetical protein
MRSVAGLVCFALALGSSTAFAQTSTAPSAGAKPGQPGIDVYSTIYPRQPSADVIQSTANLPVQPTDPTSPYPPVGIASHNLIWYPSVTGGAFFDDNVFASNRNRQGDWAGFVRPELGWRTNNWANMEAAGTAFVEQRWYDKFSSEDQFNAGAAVGGTLRPGENTQVVTRLQYLHAHEARGTSDSVNNTFTRPLRYDQIEGAGAINQRYGRMWTSVGAAAAFIRFADGDIAGAPVSQDYRNGVIARVPARFGYVVAPLTSVFVEVAANRRDFRVSDFDSRGYRVVGGMLFEPGPGSRVKGEFFAGYMNQKYNGLDFQTVSTWTVGSAMAFLLLPNLTATLEARRDARETSLSAGQFLGPGDGASVIETVAAGRLDWAIWPNLVVGAGVAYLEDEYLGVGRTDRVWSPLAALRYFPNRWLTLGFDYRYQTFDSDGLGVLGYYRNVFLFSATARI